MNLRLVAAQVIDKVLDGASLTDVLSARLTSISNPRDRAFVQAIAYGVCRYYLRLDFILSQLLEKPMRAKESLIHALLMVGLYQLMEMRVPEHAAVAETVAGAESLKKPWAKGLINAILRSYLRRKKELDESIREDEEATTLHPQWLLSSIQKAWPMEWEKVIDANNAHPPLTLRINRLQTTCHDYLQALADKSIKATILPETTMGMIIEDPLPIEELPGFREGMFSVQDGGAQLSAELLMLSPSQHVLDACAAPGGKLTHLLEIESATSVVAVEKDAERIVSIKENLKRLQLTATCVCADATDIKKWWDGKLFDRILLDAPCSATGVIRRHPDIKLLRQPHDIKALAKLQLQLLQALWPLLKPGGVLVYVTCSILPAENVEVVQQFLATEKTATEKKIDANWGIACEVGRQILPGMHQMDGFYYARLVKK